MRHTAVALGVADPRWRNLVESKLDRLGRDAQEVGATIKALAACRIKVIVLQLGSLT